MGWYVFVWWRNLVTRHLISCLIAVLKKIGEFKHLEKSDDLDNLYVIAYMIDMKLFVEG